MKKLPIVLLIILAACGGEQAAETDMAVNPNIAAAPENAAEAGVETDMAGTDLAAVKEYAVDQANQMKAATAAFRAGAEQYYALVAQAKNEHPNENPYERL